MGPWLLGLTMAAEKGRRNQTTGRCSAVWEELEMGLWRKIHSRVYTQAEQPCWGLTTQLGNRERVSPDHAA